MFESVRLSVFSREPIRIRRAFAASVRFRFYILIIRVEYKTFVPFFKAAEVKHPPDRPDPKRFPLF